jgi:hypothetical protein
MLTSIYLTIYQYYDIISIRRIPTNMEELAGEGLPGDEVDLALGLAHAFGGEGDEAHLVAQEGEDERAAGLHVEELLPERVELAVGLVDLQEAQEDGLVDEVRDRVADLPRVLVEPARRAVGGVRQPGQQHLQHRARLARLQQVGQHLVQDVGHDVSILVLPLHPVVQTHLPRLPPEVLRVAPNRRLGLAPNHPRSFFHLLQRFASFRFFLNNFSNCLKCASLLGRKGGKLGLGGLRVGRLERRKAVVLRQIENKGGLGVIKNEGSD